MNAGRWRFTSLLPLIATLASTLLPALLSASAAADDGSIQFGLPTTCPVSDITVKLADVDGGLPDLLYRSGPALVMRSNLGDMSFGPEVPIPLALSGDLVNFAVSDLDGDGHPDLIGLSTGLELCVRRGLGAGAFAGVETDALPGMANGLVAADLNGDGLPDLAVSHIDSGWVSVWTNHGDGTFGVPQVLSIGVPEHVHGSYGLTDIVAGRFDGDAHLDLAVLDHLERTTVSVFLNHGDGTFAAGIRSPAIAGYQGHLCAGDLDGDGLDDLVAGAEPPSVAVLLNHGGGTFARADSLFYPQWVGAIARPVLADVDGDGRLDLIVAYSNGVSVWFDRNYLSVRPGLGNGHFGEERELQMGREPQSAAVADLNGDGWLDAVGVSSTPYLSEGGSSAPTVWAFAGHGINGFDGYGMFFPTNTQCVGSGCADYSWLMARTRAGGRSDLLIARSGQVTLRRNRGPGAYDPPVTLPFDRVTSAVDLNHDGRDDLVLTGADSVGVALSVANAVWGPATWYIGARLIAFADFDGDGHTDLGVATPDQRLNYRAGDGAGAFGAMVATDLVLPAVPQGGVDVGDTDGDGRADVVIGTQGPIADSMFVFALPSGGGVDTLAAFEVPCVDFSQSGSICWQPYPRIARAGAGHLPNLYVMEGSRGGGSFGHVLSYHRLPDGSYAEVFRMQTPREPMPLAVADFDLDGVDEAVLVSGEDIDIGSVTVFHGDASGQLTPTFTHYTGPYEGPASIAYLDDDSRPDLVIDHRYYGRVDYLLNRTMPNEPTPALVALVSAVAESRVVRLDWFGADAAGSEARWERRTPASSWRSLGALTADGSGHFRAEDREVSPGASYAYRLTRVDGSDPTPEAWVTVPEAVTTGLSAVRPNPATLDAVAEFTLAADATVRLDVIDLLGRRVATATQRMSAGRHIAPVPGIATLHPGVYALRFESGGRVQGKRFAVIR